jgi:hypothetical protein
VVLLDQDGVEQTDAVIFAPATTHRIFLCVPQAGEGLSCIEDNRAGAFHGLDELSRPAGRAGQGLQEIECGAFTTEYGAGLSREVADFHPGVDGIPVAGIPANLNAGIQLTEGLVKPGPAGKNCVLAADDPGFQSCLLGDQTGGTVTVRDIFGQGPRDIGRYRIRAGRYVHVSHIRGL